MRYPEKDEKGDNSISFMQFALGVFTIMEMAFSPDMKLSEFTDLKTLAENQAQEYKKAKKTAIRR